MTLKLLRRTVLCTLLLPFLYFGTASATFLYRVRAENRTVAAVPLPIFPAPTARQRIVVFSPHPDDETLGCAGLLQQAVRAGASVKVVMLTNGDAFRVAVERQFRQLRVEPDDYVRFAEMRQNESSHAIGHLGVKPDDVLFLGYPDRGLMALWEENWSPDHPYTSSYTGQDHSPYALNFRKNAAYCGESLLEDVKAVLRASRPTDLYVTHPSDDHADHSAASAFVALALQQLREERLPWAQACRLHYYLVHRGDWPIPQSLHENDPLLPPSEMTALDTRWLSRPLTPEEVHCKTDTILAYQSQIAMMKRFLVSFSRRNELFGELESAHIARLANRCATLDGENLPWKNRWTVIMDPVNDSLLRNFQTGGDIQTIYACRDTENLYVKVGTYKAISSRIDLQLCFRCIGDSSRAEAGRFYMVRIHPPSAVYPSEVRAHVGTDYLVAAIPLCELGYPHRLALNVKTSIANLQIDTTGYRFLTL